MSGSLLPQADVSMMARMQDGMNCEVNPEWIKADYDWSRAIWLEAAELAEHIGWKWWKKQEPNVVQAQIELVDIWHFVLSHYMVKFGIKAPEVLYNQLNDPERKVYLYKEDLRLVDELTPLQKIDLFAGMAAVGKVNVGLFAAICQDMGLSGPDLKRMYVAKNVLNIFRQRNGYKSGAYIKTWYGAEDNVFLENLMVIDPNAAPDELYAALTKAYAEVRMTAGVAA